MKRYVALVICILMVLAGCSSAAPPEGKKLKEIDIVLDWYPNGIHAFIYNAIEKGYYADEGLKVNVRFPSNSNDALSLVAAGRAQVGLYYQQDSIIAKVNQDVPIRSIGAVTHAPLNIVLSLSEKNIHSPADLKGKTIGYAGTELSEAILRCMMDYAGVSSDDIKVVDVGFDLMSSMTTRKVDATIGCFKNHEVPQLEEEGFEVDYMELYDYGVPVYYDGILLANDQMIEKEPETLKAFLRASAKGFADMKADPEGSLKILLDNQNAENFPLSETVERQSISVLLPLMDSAEEPFLSQNAEVWQNNIDWLYEQGLIKETIEAGEMFAELD